MTKYRQHTQEKIEATKLDFNQLSGKICDCASKIRTKSEQMDELVKILNETIKDGSKENCQLLEENARLKVENETLKRLLNLANEVKDSNSVACGWSYQGDSHDDLDSSRETIISRCEAGANSSDDVN